MIFDDECLGDRLFDLCSFGCDSQSESKLSTSRPAGIVCEVNITQLTFSFFIQSNADISTQQWPFAFSFPDQTVVEFLLRPISSSEIAIENDHLCLDRR